MADYAEEISKQPPPELSLAWRCERWKALPYTGGVDDWPLAGVIALEAAIETFNAFKARAMAENALEFSKKHPAWAEYCAGIDKLRGLI